MPNEEDELVQLDEVVEKEPEPVKEAEEKAEEAGAKVGENPSQTQDRKTNAEFAQRRREAEAKAKEKAEKENHEAFVKGKIQGLGGINTYTNEPIEDEADLKEYEAMRKADEAGEDPIKAYVKMARQERVAEAKRIAEEKKAKEDGVELAKKNIAEFNTAHPNENFDALYKTNDKFKKLLDKGFHPNEAYEFLGMKPKTQQKPTPTPSSSQQGTGKGKSVKDLSDAEFNSYWEHL